MRTLALAGTLFLNACRAEPLDDTKDTAEFHSIDTATEDTGETIETGETDDTADTAIEAPIYRVSEGVAACLSLMSEGCQYNVSEGATDAACLQRQATESAAIQTKLVAMAQEATGDTAVTMEDIENDQVPGTVCASHEFEYGADTDGNTLAMRTGYLEIAFGNKEEEYRPFEGAYTVGSEGSDLPFQVMYCAGVAVSDDLETPLEEVDYNRPYYARTAIYEPEALNSITDLQITDYEVKFPDDARFHIHGESYDKTDPAYVFTSTLAGLAESAYSIMEAAFKYTDYSSNDTVVRVTE